MMCCWTCHGVGERMCRLEFYAFYAFYALYAFYAFKAWAPVFFLPQTPMRSLGSMRGGFISPGVIHVTCGFPFIIGTVT